MIAQSHKNPRFIRRAILFLLSGAVLLCLLAAWPLLTALLGGGDYTGTIALNWGLSLPTSSGCRYETDSGPSFHGDGERYHVLAYPQNNSVETALAWRDPPPEESTAAGIAQLLENLSVPEAERPDMDCCRWYTATDPDDPRNQLWLLLSPSGTRLYVLETFF